MNTIPVILVVEDEVIVAHDIRDTLISFGYTVAGTVRTGEAALESVAKTRPDLVLMDIHLAGKTDGIDAATQIHAQYGIPVIFLTAYADNALIERAKAAQPYGFIVKPYEERGLHSVIEMALYKYGVDLKLKESEDSLRKLNNELETRVAARTASLRQQLEFLQQLIDTIPAPVYYKNLTAEYLGCNNAFETYTGIPKREIVGKTDTTLFSASIAVLSTDKDSQLMNQRGIQVYQAKFPHADHQYRDVIFKKATFNDAEGGIAGFIGVIVDITDRIHAEEALRESEQRFLAIVEDQTELVWRSSPNRTCTFANTAFLRYFGRTSENTLGYFFTPPVHPDDAIRVQQHLASLSSENPAASITYRVILADGTVRSLHWNTRAFFDTSGQVREYQSVGHETA
ncbi:MAG TPA: response regulator [Methanoregulaceae archaeon]|nr:response regulator [Methanoregulaceae archaeon]